MQVTECKHITEAIEIIDTTQDMDIVQANESLVNSLAGYRDNEDQGHYSPHIC